PSGKAADFDSAIPRFESWRPSQPVQGPFRTHGLRFIPEKWVTLWSCPVIGRSEAARSLQRYGGPRSLAASLRPRSRRDTCSTLGPRGGGEGFEPAGLVTEVTEIMVHEGDEPDFLAHLFDVDLLPANAMLRLIFCRWAAPAPRPMAGCRRKFSR